MWRWWNIPDMFIPRDTGISKNHLSLNFDNYSKSWHIIDTNSANGTYLLLKSLSQFRNRDISTDIPLFQKIEQRESRTILIGRYVFFIKII